MMNESYEIVKTIPLKGGGTIPAGSGLQKVHGVYFLDGGMLPPDYQKDFEGLVQTEKKTGWNYLVPIVQKRAYGNDKEQC